MRRLSLLSSILSTALLWMPLLHAAQPQQPPHPQSLPDWEALTSDQRELLIAPQRARWNDSTPEERARLLQHARRWQAMTPEQRAAARKGMRRWEGMPPRRREHAMHVYRLTRGMTPKQRDAFITTWRGMTPEQRRQWLQEHRPAPPPHP